jgi:uncharacterized RDD family membrane protein YckC
MVEVETGPYVEIISGLEVAGWGTRFAAWLLDIVVVYVAPIVITSIVVVAAGADEATSEAFAYLVGFALLLFGPAYFALFHAGRRGQTLGKRTTGIAVLDDDTGGRLPYGRAFGRAYLMFALYFVFAVGLVVDCLWPLWDKRNQALHDKAVGSLVVRRAGPVSTPTA